MAIHTQHFTNREDWLAARSGKIGASDVGAIVGVSHFATPRQIWERLTSGERVAESVAMKMGHLLEPVVAQLWGDESGDTMVAGTDDDFIVINEKYEFAAVSPDRYFANADGEVYTVECKSTALRITEESLPRSWYCQLQYQLAVTELPFGTIAWLSNGRDFGAATYSRNDEFCDWLLKKVSDFWQSLKSGVPPEVTAADADFVYRHSCVAGSIAAATPDTIAAVARYRELRESMKSIEEEMEELAKAVKLAMGEAEALAADGGTLATWKKRNGSRTIDSRRLKAEKPEIYEEYLRAGEPTRVFKIC